MSFVRPAGPWFTMTQPIRPTRRNQTPLTTMKVRMAHIRCCSKRRLIALRQANPANTRMSTALIRMATFEMTDR